MEFILLIIVFIIGAVRSSPKHKGKKGEREVARYLKKLRRDEYKVINNLLLKTENGTSQIDHVIVSLYGIFVIETKNYGGWVLGSEYDDNWKQVLYKKTQSLRNPIKQNYGHIKALKENLKLHKNIKYISIVAFTNRATLKVDTTTPVIYPKYILEEIRKYNERIIDIKELNEIYNELINNNVDSRKMRREHIKNVKKAKTTIGYSIISKGIYICPRCGGNLVHRNGNRGTFIGCSNFPRCKFTKNI